MAAVTTVSAGAMARATSIDPQMQVPPRPKLVEGLVWMPMGETLLVEGAPERQVFRGAAATAVLPRLLPLLDGRRSADELAAEVGLSTRALAAAVALLYTRGLVEEAASHDVRTEPTEPAIQAFFSRSVDATRVNRSGTEATARLRHARLWLVGDGGAPLADALVAAGAWHVTVVTDDAAALDDAVDLVVAFSLHRPLDPAALASVDERCAELGVPWLRCEVQGATVEVGPLLDRRHTPCTACSRPDPSGGPPAATLPNAVVERAALALAAGEVVHLVTRIAPLATYRGVVRTDVATWAQERLLVARRPGCPVCCPLPAPPGPGLAAAVAYAFEQSVEFPPAHLLNPKEHQHHYKPGNIELQRHDRRLPPAARRALPRLGDVAGPAGRLGADGPPADRLDLAVLAGLLGRVGGLRDGGGAGDKLQRWAPTGGNLGSPQLAVATDGVAGLTDGVYAYLGLTHELAVLGEGRLDVAGLDQVFPGRPAAVVVMTAALDRMAAKYGSSAYRLVHLDAGCALAQLRVVAAGYGLQVDLAPSWPDAALGRALRLDLDREPITVVAALRPAGSLRA